MQSVDTAPIRCRALRYWSAQCNRGGRARRPPSSTIAPPAGRGCPGEHCSLGLPVIATPGGRRVDAEGTSRHRRTGGRPTCRSASPRRGGILTLLESCLTGCHVGVALPSQPPGLGGVFSSCETSFRQCLWCGSKRGGNGSVPLWLPADCCGVCLALWQLIAVATDTPSHNLFPTWQVTVIMQMSLILGRSARVAVVG